MLALGRRHLIGDQPRGVLEAYRERQSPGRQPAQTSAGNVLKEKTQLKVEKDQ